MAKQDCWNGVSLFEEGGVDRLGIPAARRGQGGAAGVMPRKADTSGQGGQAGSGGERSPGRAGVSVNYLRSVDRLMSVVDLPAEPDLFRDLRAQQSGLPRYRFNFPGGIVR
ncbi:MAG TPA: hypothetical protein VMC79_11135 [Rectinemataceae bacterium]|nr:hypothetical protein [Rectinemataceae bacterium]